MAPGLELHRENTHKLSVLIIGKPLAPDSVPLLQVADIRLDANTGYFATSWLTCGDPMPGLAEQPNGLEGAADALACWSAVSVAG
jgi:hypothetical protein